jgi:hypothetical protein
MLFERIEKDSKEVAKSYGIKIVDHVPATPKEEYHKKRS